MTTGQLLTDMAETRSHSIRKLIL